MSSDPGSKPDMNLRSVAGNTPAAPRASQDRKLAGRNIRTALWLVALALGSLLAFLN